MKEKNTGLTRYIESQIKQIKMFAETWSPLADDMTEGEVTDMIRKLASDAHLVISFVYVYQETITCNNANNLHSLVQNAEHNAIELIRTIRDRYETVQEEE